jgi:hypothetical protein
MRYVLLFVGTPEDQAEWDRLSQAERRARYANVGQWFEANATAIRATQQLQAPSTATTVRRGRNGTPLVTDGPFVESKEIVGGYAEIEVADFAAALEMAKSWPGGPVEIRPVVAQR